MDAKRRARLQDARDSLRALYTPHCLLCEIRCAVDRAADQRGVCGLARDTPVYRRLIHFGEERELVPSYAVWLAGCNFLCSFCSDEQALRPPFPGRVYTPAALAETIADDLEATRHSVRNINFVGGDPSISLPYITDVALALAERLAEVPPLLLNTNGFLTRDALEAAIDVCDIFVVDFKFGNDDCARRIGTPKRYWKTLCRNLARLATSGRKVWIRHLLMPDHLECCTRPVLEQVASWPHFEVNMMPAFVAFGADWRSLSKAEIAAGRALFDSSPIALKHWDGKRLPSGAAVTSPRDESGSYSTTLRSRSRSES